MRTKPARVAASVLTAVAVAIVILAVAVVVFLNPAWIGLVQDRSDVTGWTGYPPQEVRAATHAILGDLVLGPPDFDAAVAGVPVLDETERGHMRDVRSVFAGFAVLALVSAGWLVLVRRRLDGREFWRAVRNGAGGLIGGLVVAGAIAALAFDAAFSVFHGIFFSGGNWSFDPATSRLVQLFPMQFWFETTLAVGLVAGVLALIVVVLAARRSGSATAAEVGVGRPVPVSR